MGRYEPSTEADAHTLQQERWLLTRPICDMCGERIQDECAYEVDGKLICEECITYCRKWID